MVLCPDFLRCSGLAATDGGCERAALKEHLDQRVVEGIFRLFCFSFSPSVRAKTRNASNVSTASPKAKRAHSDESRMSSLSRARRRLGDLVGDRTPAHHQHTE